MSLSRCIKLAGLLLAALALPSFADSTSADDQVHAFVVGKLWPGSTAPITNAVMLVADGQIRQVGSLTDVKIPDSAVRHELPNAVVVPGFVIAETSIGIASDDERTLTPEVRAIDGFDLFADYSQYVAAGITTVQISPGRQRLMPGQGAVVKLAGNDHSRRVLEKEESLRLILSSESANAPRIYEPPVGAVSVDNPLDPTRPQIAESLAARIAGLRAIFAAAKAGEVDEEGIVDFESVRQSLKRGRFRIKANSDAEVRAALSLFTELQMAVDRKLRLTLTDPTELDSFLEQMSQLKTVGIVLNAGLRPGLVSNPTIPKKNEPASQQPWQIAKSLIEAELSDAVAIRPASDADLDEMLFLAGLFTRDGVAHADVLKMLTSNPASILGVADKVGSLNVGLDADFVVLTGDPFETGTLIQSTWINGESVYQREPAEKSTLIEAATVYTSGGKHITDGRLLIGNKKIQAVGTSVSVPEDARVKRFPNAVIVPGFLDLGTGLGFGGTVSRVTLATKLGDRLASDDPTIQFARQGGITTAVFASTTSPSPMLAFKLGDTPRLLKEPVAIRFSMSTNLTSGVPSLKRTLTTAKAYSASWTKYESDLAAYKIKLKTYQAALAKYTAMKKVADAKKAAEDKKVAEAKAKADAAKKASVKKTGDADKKDASSAEKKADEKTDSSSSKDKAAEESKKSELKVPVKPSEPKKPKSSSTYEPYRALFAGKIPAVVKAGNVKAIKAAVKLFREEFQLPMILIGADDAYRVADLLAKNKVAVSLGPSLVRSVDNKQINQPQVMANHQIPLAFQSNATTGVQQLPLAVQYSVYRGLGTTDALIGLTESPSKLLSLDQTIGSLEAGKDADLVVLSGPPFEPSSQVLAVMIDGAWVYERGATP
ncbi:MAG: amidohydrolase family protein [Fuerstiella sp.]